MNKVITAVVIILIVVGGYFLFFNKSNAPAVNENQGTPTTGTITNNPIATSSVTVNYTDSGFSPQVITIRRGDSVTFINESSGGMSIASDPHPTHTNYPEFDQYKSAERENRSYTFVFDRVGSWGYHNHLSSSMTGTVVVE